MSETNSGSEVAPTATACSAGELHTELAPGGWESNPLPPSVYGSETMSEEQADYLTGIHELDQNDAELEGITRAVARHFKAMIAAGMSECAAVQLCLGFQHDLMGGDGASIMLVGGDDDE